MSENKEQSKIPKSKIQRASRFARTGLKVGNNYVKHYSKKIFDSSLEKEELDKKNASDIFDTLSELKGSALKVAQMMSMDKGVLPAAYANKFAQAQHNAPPLSAPLIAKSFKTYFGKTPGELFDSFESQAAHAASIGQVHRASKDGVNLAVKIQYPGVRESVVSDLNMAQGFARQLLGVKPKEFKPYFEEVKRVMLEETDYNLELKRGQEIAKKCEGLDGLIFPAYFSEYSCQKVLTMTWLEGVHLDKYLASNPGQEERNRLGQVLWDFYNFQVHQLHVMHADAHPGNFLFQAEGNVAVLDFGCVKEIPVSFYKNYFTLLEPGVLEDEKRFEEICYETGMIFLEDSAKDKEFYKNLFKEAISLVCQPFYASTFDFGDPEFMKSIYAYGDRMRNDPNAKKLMKPRGDKDGIYMNRAYFGLFSILSSLGAQINTQKFLPTT